MIIDNLADLADRVECLIPTANDGDMLWWQVQTAVQRYVGAPDHPRWRHEADRNVWWWGDWQEDRDWDCNDRNTGEYLTSWDAAYSLVIPGWRLAMAGMGDQWTAGLTSTGTGRTVGASARTAPLAIVAAAIRSRLPGWAEIATLDATPKRPAETRRNP